MYGERGIQIIARPPNPTSSLTPLLSFGRPANLAVDMSKGKCRGASQTPSGIIRPYNAKGDIREQIHHHQFPDRGYGSNLWPNSMQAITAELLKHLELSTTSPLPFLTVPNENPLELPHGVFPRTMVKQHYESPRVFSHTVVGHYSCLAVF